MSSDKVACYTTPMTLGGKWHTFPTFPTPCKPYSHPLDPVYCYIYRHSVFMYFATSFLRSAAARELRAKKYMKIVSLAPEVL